MQVRGGGGGGGGGGGREGRKGGKEGGREGGIYFIHCMANIAPVEFQWVKRTL